MAWREGIWICRTLCFCFIRFDRRNTTWWWKPDHFSFLSCILKYQSWFLTRFLLPHFVLTKTNFYNWIALFMNEIFLLAHQTLVWNGLLLWWCSGGIGVSDILEKTLLVMLGFWIFAQTLQMVLVGAWKISCNFFDLGRNFGQKGVFRMRLSLWTMKNWHFKFCV